MLDTKLEPTTEETEAAVVLAEHEEPPAAEAATSDEELADELVVEISVDGMCGVY